MLLDLREILPGILNYPASLTYILVQLVVVRGRSTAAAAGPSVPRVRSDMTYFLPVLAWGIESVLHAHQAMFGPSRYCFGFPVWAFACQALLSGSLGVVLIATGFLSERWARSGGRPLREMRAALPLPVVAALVGVQLNWSLHLVAYVPFR
jgi:hypothetical protein